MTPKDIARAAIVAAALGGFQAALAAAPATVTQPINDRQTVTLPGNTRPEARLTTDRGALPADFKLDHIPLAPNEEAEVVKRRLTLVEQLTAQAQPLNSGLARAAGRLGTVGGGM